MPTTIRNEKLFCTCCGGEFAIIYPISVTEFTKKSNLFAKLHKNCHQTWTEPQVDQSQTVRGKAMFWFKNGEHGNSSSTIWYCLMGEKQFRINHPYDPDDFSRCYKLLETVPEWKLELDKLKSLSKEWSALIENWDKLTEMFENKDDKMYEFMKKLLND